MKKASKEMVISEIVRLGEGIPAFFVKYGLNCASGCPNGQRDTLVNTAAKHGVDADALIDEINAHLEAQAA